MSLRRRIALPPLRGIVEVIARFEASGYDLDKQAFMTPWWLNAQRGWLRSLRLARWQLLGVRVGEAVSFSDHVKILGPKRLSIGNRSKILNHVILDARGGLKIGSETQIGFESIVLTSSHRFDDIARSVVEQGMTRREVQIGNDVWLGTRVIVLPGVTIGDHVIVGAGSIVTGDIPKNAIAAGNPAKVLRERD